MLNLTQVSKANPRDYPKQFFLETEFHCIAWAGLELAIFLP
jgi:hypothetical protein